jgi:cytochrome c
MVNRYLKTAYSLSFLLNNINPEKIKTPVKANVFLIGLCLTAALFSCTKDASDIKAPDEHRFRKVILAESFVNPMELDVAFDNRVYVAEGGGSIKIYDPIKKSLKIAGRLDTHDGYEFGLIGIVLDLNFKDNGWVYCQYNPKSEPWIQRVSRFTIKNDSLDISSEKFYFRIPYETNCCHSAGSLAFDSKGNLYASTGDNTDSFFTHYALTDDRPGNLKNDALRSAANSKDYRGKILRIHPETDGTYTIPKDNLFPDTTQGKPEIYIMGCRNPYRITVDKATDILYWGEVGPDADRDSTRGPRAYDEFNRATKAGNFGWPFFIGDSKAYNKVDFANGDKIGEKFNPEKPVNFSKNNTGIKNLPPAQKAFIWYPYDASKEFPSFGTGGRTAIGGPVYQYNSSSNSPVKFPPYFDGCWFIGEWMRNWLKAVHIDGEGKISKIDNFMPGADFKKPMDMAFGPDGALYMLEFGSSWMNNTDTKLVRIEYINGNRVPVPIITADKLYGSAPLTVNLSAEKSFDYDKDELEFEWRDQQNKIFSKNKTTTFTFDKPGKYKIGLMAIDPFGRKKEQDLEFFVGNDMPQVKIVLANNTFYRDTVNYTVNVIDGEDGELGKGISPAKADIQLTYLPKGKSLKNADGATVIVKGEVLINESDCKGCHKLDEKTIGPSFKMISEKYRNEPPQITRLADKIIRGGGGVWGEHNMSAHPQLRTDQASEMVKYIISLTEDPGTVEKIPASGSFYPDPNITTGKEGTYIIEASYTDKGGNFIGSLTSKDSKILRYPKIYPSELDKIYDSKIINGTLNGLHNSHGCIKDIDLTGIKQIFIKAGGSGGRMEVRIDSAKGKMIGKALLDQTGTAQRFTMDLKPIAGTHDIYVVFANEKYRFWGMDFYWMTFNNKKIDMIGDGNSSMPLPISWKFKTGDNMQFASPSFNDASWTKVPVAAKWQTAGFDYVGYAWYRVKVVIPSSFKSKMVTKGAFKGILKIVLGAIDDTDQAFFNGKSVGQTGTFPPTFNSGWGKLRSYIVDTKDIKWDQENTIAVRVYSPDAVGGGMYQGPYKMEVFYDE